MLVYFFVGLMLALLLLGVPVAFVIGLPCIFILFFTTTVPLEVVPQLMTGAVNSSTLLAIPLFLLAGSVMNSAGITSRIFRFARACVGYIRGGLGHVSILASLLFAGMCGSAVAEAAGLGVVEVKAMKEAGYDIEFAAGLTAAGACIGPVFPPSIIFVIYGVMAEVSIGKLFIGGMVPGVLMALSLMVWVYITARRRGYPKDARPNLKEFFLSFKEAFLALLTPVIIIGGILSGIFTATEAAIVTALWALFLGFFVYRELTLSNFIRILKQVAVQSAAVMFITSTAMVIGWILMRYRMPQILTTYLEQFSKNPYMILILVNIFFLVLGCFMEVIASLVILTPILVPALSRMGIDPLHFGVVMTLNLMIGLLTPPFGMGLYTVQKVAGISFEQMVRGAVPFLLPLLVVLGMITFWPQLVLFLPNLVIGK